MKRWKIFAFSILVSLFAKTVQAVPMVNTAACLNDSDKQCAIGITGLDVTGMLFDVAFNQSSYNDIFQNSDPFFLGDEEGARSAALALAPALTGWDVIGIPGDIMLVFIPYFNYGVDENYNLASCVTPRYGSWISDCYAGIDNSIGSDGSRGWFDSYAVFTPHEAAIPTPATLSLLGLASASLGFIRRKRKLHS
ncbi:MAG: hypothetical protein R3E64_12985 [Halioglobus sp.]